MSKCKDNPEKECTCFENDFTKARKAIQDYRDSISKRFKGADGHMIGGSKYKEMQCEPWKEMELTESKEDFLTYLRIAAKKHQLRLGQKEGTTILEDMEKAEHIIQKWIEVYKS